MVYINKCSIFMSLLYISFHTCSLSSFDISCKDDLISSTCSVPIFYCSQKLVIIWIRLTSSLPLNLKRILPLTLVEIIYIIQLPCHPSLFSSVLYHIDKLIISIPGKGCYYHPGRNQKMAVFLSISFYMTYLTYMMQTWTWVTQIKIGSWIIQLFRDGEI